MAIALVQSTISQGSQNTLTGVTAGNTLHEIVPFIINTGNATANPVMGDSQGQTWLADNVPGPVGGGGGTWIGVAAYSIPNALAGSHTPTATVAGSLSVSQVLVELSGMPLTASHDQNGTNGDTTTGTVTKTCTVGTTTTQANEIAIGGIIVQTNSGASAALTDPPAGWTSIGVRNTYQGSNFGFEACYQLLSSQGNPSASWSWTGAGSTRNQEIITTYKGPVASGGGSGGDGLGGGLDGGLVGGFS